MAGIHELNFFLSYFFAGAFDTEEAAARTYDLAALKYWGSDSTLNFPVSSVSICHCLSNAACLLLRTKD